MTHSPRNAEAILRGCLGWATIWSGRLSSWRGFWDRPLMFRRNSCDARRRYVKVRRRSLSAFTASALTISRQRRSTASKGVELTWDSGFCQLALHRTVVGRGRSGARTLREGRVAAAAFAVGLRKITRLAEQGDAWAQDRWTSSCLLLFARDTGALSAITGVARRQGMISRMAREKSGSRRLRAIDGAAARKASLHARGVAATEARCLVHEAASGLGDVTFADRSELNLLHETSGGSGPGRSTAPAGAWRIVVAQYGAKVVRTRRSQFRTTPRRGSEGWPCSANSGRPARRRVLAWLVPWDLEAEVRAHHGDVPFLGGRIQHSASLRSRRLPAGCAGGSMLRMAGNPGA
ncbi:hypothetical protein FQR65_LT20973 [Abscondita terminalis]|nr:hypothetical protein FQR65_LT20973 [Abscondita terminalis]